MIKPFPTTEYTEAVPAHPCAHGICISYTSSTEEKQRKSNSLRMNAVINAWDFISDSNKPTPNMRCTSNVHPFVFTIKDSLCFSSALSVPSVVKNKVLVFSAPV